MVHFSFIKRMSIYWFNRIYWNAELLWNMMNAHSTNTTNYVNFKLSVNKNRVVKPNMNISISVSNDKLPRSVSVYFYLGAQFDRFIAKSLLSRWFHMNDELNRCFIFWCLLRFERWTRNTLDKHKSIHINNITNHNFLLNWWIYVDFVWFHSISAHQFGFRLVFSHEKKKKTTGKIPFDKTRKEMTRTEWMWKRTFV